jgi:hypothetical protein
MLIALETHENYTVREESLGAYRNQAYFCLHIIVKRKRAEYDCVPGPYVMSNLTRK